MNLEQTKEFKKVYSRLQDDISRRIYKQRLLYSLLGDKQELYQLACDNSKIEELLNAKKFCFYGAGVGGENLIKFMNTIYYPWYPDLVKPSFVIDNNKTGEIENLPIISFKEFLELPDYKEYLIIITVGNKKAKNEIEKSLNQYDLKYLHGYKDFIPEGRTYFDLPELNLENEYFVDGGAFDGTSTKQLFELSGVGYSYVFEANPNQIDSINKTLSMYKENITVYPYGMYNENKTMKFLLTEYVMGCSICEDGQEIIEVRKLDDILKDKPVTFIKMDIEGSELAALKGAENIIRTQKPKLAICVYHKPEDMWEIPSLLLEYCPDYKFYLRHYSADWSDTVLYAII